MRDLSATRREAEFAKILAPDTVLGQEIACEQALRGALAGGRGGGKRKGSLQLRLWNWKVDAKCWLAKMTLVMTSLHVFFNVCLHSRSFLRRADWRKSDSSVDGETQGNWRWNSNYRDVVESSPSFSRPTAGAPRRACSQASQENANGIRDRGDKSLGCGIGVKNNRVTRSRPVWFHFPMISFPITWKHGQLDV